MTTATIPGIDQTPTDNQRLLAWVREVAELTTPTRSCGATAPRPSGTA